ncbi:MAG: tandem-95 repeat protein [Sphingomonadaceae bacterium]|nr:tandem-95 repeat protein [Sphingomonadaceae bacterium]
MTTPNSEEQYLLELINEARLDPQASAARYLSTYSPLVATQASIQDAMDFFGVNGSSLSSAYAQLATAGPLAWNSSLASAADKHSAAMISADEQSHQVSGESALGARVSAEGYNYSVLGENVYAYADDVLYAHAGFMVDWGYDGVDYSGSTLLSNFATLGDGIQDGAGHRDNIMNPAFREVGIDVTYENDSTTDVGNLVVTQDFGASSSYFVTGVAYTDNDGDDFYSFGEGRGDLTVQIGSASVTSYGSGGYSLVASTGDNSVNFSGGGLAGTVTVRTAIQGENVKLDIVDGKTLLTSASVVVDGGVSEIRALGTEGLTIEAGSGAQKIIGTAADDVLSGGTGNDTFVGGLGNDEIIGGAGTDMAIFEGNHITYTVGTNTAGVTLISSSASGTDTTEGIEIFRFSNGDFNLVNGLLTRTGEGNSGGDTDGYNVIEGTNNAETLNGTNAADLFIGKLGNDTIHGGDGVDISSYSGHVNSYTVGSKGESTVIIGTDSGADTLDGVEIFRFSNGDFVKGSDGILVPYQGDGELNQAPEVAASQNLSTYQATSLTLQVVAVDPDGDALTYSAQNGSHGLVSHQGGGQFLYTPSSSFTGYDSFEVYVKDGNGGLTTQTVNVGVAGDPAANEAPQVLSTQLASTSENTPVSITIQASDPDGDPLTFIADDSAHGSITGGSAGVFEYTPDSGYAGFDSFDVTVSDGNGGEATLTVTVLVEEVTGGGGGGEPINHAPVVDLVQTVILDDMGKATITVAATDQDGDPLEYDAGQSGDGVVTGGTNGVFTYVAKPSFDNKDNFTVTISDGNGGTATQEVTIMDTLPSYQILMANGFKGTVGGNGAIFGTQSFQDVTLLDSLGAVELDASFNRGGDIVRLPLTAASYKVSIDGSSAILNDGNTTYSIPVGANGLALVFADGVRNLAVDTDTGEVKIGSQALTATPTDLTAPSDGTALPGGVNPSASSFLSLEDGSEITLGGDYAIFGTLGAEVIHYLSGDMTLDGSFNRGGDILHLPEAASAYSAYFIGTSLVLTSSDGDITIPVGINGMTLDFDGDARVLKIDTDADAIVIGEQEITGTSANSATDLGGGNGGGNGGGGTGGGSDVSLDGFSASVVTLIELLDGEAYTITDNGNISTNVVIEGMDADDVINVTGVGGYSFTSQTADGDGLANDLKISFNDGESFTQILVKDVLTTGSFVYDQATAEIAAGWDLITFG